MTIARASPAQKAGNIADATTPNAKAFPNNVAVGSMVVVTISSDGTGTFTSGSCTKSAGTATIDGFQLDKQQNNATDQHCAFWSALVTGAGSLTVSVATGGSFSFVSVNEYTGNWDSGRVETTNGANGTTGTTPSSGNVTSAGAALFVGAVAVGNSALITLTENSNFASIFESPDGTAHEVGEHIDRIVTSGTTDAASWTLSIAPNNTATAVVVYKETGGGGGSSPSRSILRHLGAYGAYQLFRRETRSYTNASPDQTAVLGGQALSSAQGTLIPVNAVPLTGQALTGSQGTLTPAATVALTGSALASAQGTAVPTNAVPLTGSALASALGTLTAVGGDAGGDVSVALTGSVLASAAGTLTPTASIPVTGSALTGAAGTLVPATASTLAGQFLASVQGALTALGGDVNVALTGLSMSFATGLLTPSGGAVVQTDFSGGFLYEYERAQGRRRKRQQELDETERAQREITNAIDREIADLLQKQEREDERKAELDRLQALVQKFERVEESTTERVAKAFARARTQANVSAYLALEREVERMMEEEEFSILMLLLDS